MTTNKQQLNEQELNYVAGSGVAETVKTGVEVVKTGVEVAKKVTDALSGGTKKTETKTATPAAGPTNNINNQGNNNKNVIVNGNNAGGISM